MVLSFLPSFFFFFCFEWWCCSNSVSYVLFFFFFLQWVRWPFKAKLLVAVLLFIFFSFSSCVFSHLFLLLFFLFVCSFFFFSPYWESSAEFLVEMRAPWTQKCFMTWRWHYVNSTNSQVKKKEKWGANRMCSNSSFLWQMQLLTATGVTPLQIKTYARC